MPYVETDMNQRLKNCKRHYPMFALDIRLHVKRPSNKIVSSVSKKMYYTT